MNGSSGNARRSRWTRERILEEIRKRHAAGLPLRGVWRIDYPLNSAACRYFGGWRKALLAAGLPAKPFREWTPERVVEAIRVRFQQGRMLENVRREDSGLEYAGKRCFGSWQAALEAAGVSLPHRWSAKRVLAEIQRRRQEGLPLVGLCRREPALFSAASRYFGSWPAAMAAAGIDPTPRWSQGVLV
jgi:hypothetical protein